MRVSQACVCHRQVVRIPSMGDRAPRRPPGHRCPLFHKEPPAQQPEQLWRAEFLGPVLMLPLPGHHGEVPGQPVPLSQLECVAFSQPSSTRYILFTFYKCYKMDLKGDPSRVPCYQLLPVRMQADQSLSGKHQQNPHP